MFLLKRVRKEAQIVEKLRKSTEIGRDRCDRGQGVKKTYQNIENAVLTNEHNTLNRKLRKLSSYTKSKCFKSLLKVNQVIECPKDIQ